jgi:hypothetical protein
MGHTLMVSRAVIVVVIIIIIIISGSFVYALTSAPQSASINADCSKGTQTLESSGLQVINSSWNGGGFGNWQHITVSIASLVTVAHADNISVVFYQDNGDGLSLMNNFYFSVGSTTYLATC